MIEVLSPLELRSLERGSMTPEKYGKLTLPRRLVAVEKEEEEEEDDGG